MRIPRLVFALLLVTSVLQAGRCLAEPLIIDTQTFAGIEVDELVRRAATKRIIFFGENHVSSEDHEAQLLFLRKLFATGKRLALAHESIGFESQKALDLFNRREVEEDVFFFEYLKTSAPSYYHLLRPIFHFCRENRIPIIGIRANTAILYKLFNKGYQSLDTSELEQLPGYDAACSVPPRYYNFMNQFAKSTPPFSFIGPKDPYTCQFFMGLDSVMAYNVAQYAEANPDTIVVVMGGALHAWKHGMPSHLAKHTDASWVSIFPSVSTEVNIGYNLTWEDADYVWWHH